MKPDGASVMTSSGTIGPLPLDTMSSPCPHHWTAKRKVNVVGGEGGEGGMQAKTYKA